ncbi:hypothetical protein [Tranquillimonas alkanivorans]|uniref:Uncharacterized protein n=1 Tax=Tranquillimonas alkanivorans TaxID=441119 RepID=A0A1I5TS98_9RHOB|nr:hypothetical protein [Tranquillimonas alkanivorans]SFP85949.1 hypothetical protein SAMN04488047_1153 [Tranquillimonas alkanivorans]
MNDFYITKRIADDIIELNDAVVQAQEMEATVQAGFPFVLAALVITGAALLIYRNTRISRPLMFGIALMIAGYSGFAGAALHVQRNSGNQASFDRQFALTQANPMLRAAACRYLDHIEYQLTDRFSLLCVDPAPAEQEDKGFMA